MALFKVTMAVFQSCHDACRSWRWFGEGDQPFGLGGLALRFLRLTAEERRNVQVVRCWNLLADFADVLLDLMHHVRGLHRLLHDFAAGFPSLWQEGLLWQRVF